MTNCIFMYNNLIDDSGASITPSSAVSTFPIGNLQNPFRTKVARVSGVAEWYGTNLVADGGMEELGGWDQYGTPANEQRTATEYYEGSYSWYFESNGANDGVSNVTAWTQTTGKTYLCSGYVLPDSGTTVNVKVLRGDGAAAAYDVQHTDLTQSAWNHIEFVYTDISGGAAAEIAFYDGDGDTGDWYVDKVQVFEGLVTNGGFEIGGTGDNFNGGAEVDDGTSDTFTGWTNVSVNDGAGDKIEATATKKTQSYAVKLTRTTQTTYMYQYISVTAGRVYKLSFWARGDGANAGEYRLYDVQNAAWIISTTSTGVSGATYTEVTVVFTVPSGCTQVSIHLRSTSVAGTAYFDCVHVQEVITGYITFDLGSHGLTDIDCVALANYSWGSNPGRVTLEHNTSAQNTSWCNPETTADLTWALRPTANGNEACIVSQFTDTSDQYFRLVFSDGASTSVYNSDIGRIYIGPSFTPTLDYEHSGYELDFNDPSMLSQTPDGQKHLDELTAYRYVKFNFKVTTQAQLESFQKMWNEVRMRKNLFVAFDYDNEANEMTIYGMFVTPMRTFHSDPEWPDLRRVYLEFEEAR